RGGSVPPPPPPGGSLPPPPTPGGSYRNCSPGRSRLRYTRLRGRSRLRTTARHHLVRVELGASAVLLGVAAAWSALRGFDLVAAAVPTPAALIAGVASGLALAATLPLITAPR